MDSLPQPTNTFNIVTIKDDKIVHLVDGCTGLVPECGDKVRLVRHLAGETILMTYHVNRRELWIDCAVPSVDVKRSFAVVFVEYEECERLECKPKIP